MKSMVEPSIEELLDTVDNRFSLVIIAARRARQLIEDEKFEANNDTEKALSHAIDEINSGEVTYEYVEFNK